MRDEHRGREQAHGCERDAVSVSDRAGDGANVRYLPADGDACGRRSDHGRKLHQMRSGAEAETLAAEDIGECVRQREKAIVVAGTSCKLETHRKTV